MAGLNHPEDQTSVKALLESCQAVLHGHFKLASGRHSDIYVEKFRIIEQPSALSGVCTTIAKYFEDHAIDIVVGPTTGGIIVAFEIGRQMGKPAIYAELVEKQRTLRRNAYIPAGARCLLVDDVLTTGISLREVIPLITGAGAVLAGVGVLIDRSEGSLDFGCDAFAACRFEATTYAEDAIPDWLAKVPLYTPGTRAKA